MEKGDIFLGLGTNLGNRVMNINKALERINSLEQVDLLEASSFYRSEPWGVKDQPWFLNAACEIDCRCEPHELLTLLKQMEINMGRDPDAARWGPRIIDLDILLWRDNVVHSDNLVIPHPYLTERLFALMPLLEIDPDLNHPESETPLREYSEDLKKTKDRPECFPYEQTV